MPWQPVATIVGWAGTVIYLVFTFGGMAQHQKDMDARVAAMSEKLDRPYDHVAWASLPEPHR